MAGMGNIMNALFGSGSSNNTAGMAATSNAAPVGGNPALEKAGNNVVNNPNNANPAAGGKDGNGQGNGPTADSTGTGDQASPLDKFKELWQNPPVDPKAPRKTSVLDVDPAKLLESAKTQDFTKFVKSDDLAAIGKGGDDAVKAMSGILQDALSTMYAQQGMTTAQIVKAAVQENTREIMAQLPEMMRKQGFGNDLREKHPVFSHPAAKPLGEALVSRLATTNPQATAAELQDMADGYLTAFAESFIPKKDEPSSGVSARVAKDNAMDWSTFLPK